MANSSAIDSILLTLTGKSPAIGKSFPVSKPIVRAGGAQEYGAITGRALDRAPRGVGFEYEEYSNVGAGVAGDSKWSCYM